MIESIMGCEMIVSICTHMANESPRMIESIMGYEMIVSVVIVSIRTHMANEMIESTHDRVHNGL